MGVRSVLVEVASTAAEMVAMKVVSMDLKTAVRSVVVEVASMAVEMFARTAAVKVASMDV